MRLPASFLVALVATLALSTQAAWTAPITFETAVLADSPIAYWRLNESPGAPTAADRTGNGHDGTYSAIGVTLGQPGLFGGDTAARFDGAIGGVSVPFSAAFNPTRVTIEGLVNWAGSNGFQQRILERAFFLGGEQAQYGLSIRDDGRVQFEIRAGGGPSFETGVAMVPVGVATLVGGTFDGTTMQIFINGVLDQTQTASFVGDIQANPVSGLGVGNQFERNRPFNGIIDEVALYGQALSGDQIATHAAALRAIPEPSTWLLLATGFVGVLGLGRHRRKQRRR